MVSVRKVPIFQHLHQFQMRFSDLLPIMQPIPTNPITKDNIMSLNQITGRYNNTDPSSPTNNLINYYNDSLALERPVSFEKRVSLMRGLKLYN